MVTVGLAREAHRRGLSVQTFKKGPDYIDPLWLRAASGNGCYNLDPWLQQQDELQATFQRHTAAGTLALVEGTMGLHDGLQSDGSDCNAAIAKLLDLQVVLVVDCRGMHRTIAALVNGIQQFDTDVSFAGVILNRVRSTRHGSKVRVALNDHCDIKVLGELPDCADLGIAEKQLGLVPAPEFGRTEQHVEAVADLVASHCDLPVLFDQVLPAQSGGSTVSSASLSASERALRIGIAKDEAFHFYYQDDLDAFEKRGAELLEISPMRDTLPGDLDGLIIGGGFPERYAADLHKNKTFRHQLRTAIGDGLAVHAECAGLMYLCRSLLLDDSTFDMVGVFAADVKMNEKPLGRGYMKLRRLTDNRGIAAHEFHHSSVEFDQAAQFTYAIERGYGIDGEYDGICAGNAHASFAHFRHTRASPWIDTFLHRVKMAAGVPD